MPRLKNMVVPESGRAALKTVFFRFPGEARGSGPVKFGVEPSERHGKERCEKTRDFCRGRGMTRTEESHEGEIVVEAEINSVPVRTVKSGRDCPSGRGNAQVILAHHIEFLETSFERERVHFRMICVPLCNGLLPERFIIRFRITIKAKENGELLSTDIHAIDIAFAADIDRLIGEKPDHSRRTVHRVDHVLNVSFAVPSVRHAASGEFVFKMEFLFRVAADMDCENIAVETAETFAFERGAVMIDDTARFDSVFRVKSLFPGFDESAAEAELAE